MLEGIDHIGVSVVFFCHDGKGKFLMGKRTDKNRDEHGLWESGGGALEFGETVEERLQKEVKEEYCTDVLNYEFLGFREVHRLHNGQKTHWIALDFKVLVDPNKVKNGEPDKFEEIGWFTFKNLPQNLHSEHAKFFKMYREKLKEFYS